MTKDNAPEKKADPTVEPTPKKTAGEDIHPGHLDLSRSVEEERSQYARFADPATFTEPH